VHLHTGLQEGTADRTPFCIFLAHLVPCYSNLPLRITWFSAQRLTYLSTGLYRPSRAGIRDRTPLLHPSDPAS
jgi:hypothetical protein